MHRKKILGSLDSHKPYDDQESQSIKRIKEFIVNDAHCFDNFNAFGHITASAWIFDPIKKKIGLIYHKKLHKWLQPGGHSDNRSDPSKEAIREAEEEFGPSGLKLSSDEIFDIDIHTIAEDVNRKLGQHLHFDIRYLVYGDSTIKPILSDESIDARWIFLKDVHKFNNERSIIRLVEKTYTL